MCVCVCARARAHLGGVISSIGVSLMGVGYLLRENILGAGYTQVDGSHSGSRG